MTSDGTPSQALVAFLQSIPQPFRPAWFGDLVIAATTISDPRDAAVIFTLLGTAGSYGSDAPPSGRLIFPQDHQMHLNMGTEWYWYSFNATVDGTDGLDRIGGFATVKRVRAVSNAVQAMAGWSDTEAQLTSTTGTVTLATRDRYETLRRRPNVQWPALGGEVEFSVAGQPFFFRNGADFLKGSLDVLPLTVHIDDAPHMAVDVTMSSSLPSPSAFFIQEGKLDLAGAFAGFYYSWPQLAVEGTVTANGRTYGIHGTGWICHQMIMMLDPVTPPAPPLPSPFVAPSSVAGWSWCQFNLANGDAFTAVAAQSGPMRDRLSVPYGWYLRRQGDAWNRTFLNGSLQLDRFVPGIEGVMIPSSWTYAAADAFEGARSVDAAVIAVPWYPDGSFHDFDRQVQGETAVDVALVNSAAINAQSGSGTVLTGSGYCESVGYEPLQSYVKRALAFLKRNQR